MSKYIDINWSLIHSILSLIYLKNLYQIEILILFIIEKK